MVAQLGDSAPLTPKSVTVHDPEPVPSTYILTTCVPKIHLTNTLVQQNTSFRTVSTKVCHWARC